MGYRSEVGLEIKSEVLNKALSELKEQDDKTYKLVDKLLFEEADVHLERDDWQLFVWTCIKWYSGMGMYADVDWVEKLIKTLEESVDVSDNMPFTFVRLGQENADVDVRGTYMDTPFNLSWTRDLVWDGGTDDN